MLKTISINKGKVTKMYRNKQKIWEMPKCGIINIEGAELGSQRISVKTYPEDAQVQIIIGYQNGEDKTFKGKTTVFGNYSLFLDDKLSAKYVEVKVEAEGFLVNSRFIKF